MIMQISQNTNSSDQTTSINYISKVHQISIGTYVPIGFPILYPLLKELIIKIKDVIFKKKNYKIE